MVFLLDVVEDCDELPLICSGSSCIVLITRNVRSVDKLIRTNDNVHQGQQAFSSLNVQKLEYKREPNDIPTISGSECNGPSLGPLARVQQAAWLAVYQKYRQVPFFSLSLLHSKHASATMPPRNGFVRWDKLWNSSSYLLLSDASIQHRPLLITSLKSRYGTMACGTVDAEVDYLQRLPLYQHEKPFQLFVPIHERDQDARSTNLEFEKRMQTFVDIRDRVNEFSLDSHGFQVETSPSRLNAQSFRDQNLIKDEYLPEVENLLKLVGNSHDRIFIFDWRVSF